jgi:hypothetical protein
LVLTNILKGYHPYGGIPEDVFNHRWNSDENRFPGQSSTSLPRLWVLSHANQKDRPLFELFFYSSDPGKKGNAFSFLPELQYRFTG